MYLTGALVILALVAVGSETPLCDLQTFATCIMPVMMYSMGPEGQQLRQIKDIIDNQLVSACRIGRTALLCFTGAADRCIPSDLLEFGEIMTGVNSLMAVCDRPDLHSKTRLLMQCGKTLNATRGSKTRACTNAAIRESMTDIQGQQGRSMSETEQLWRSGGVMKKLCCTTKYYETCSGTEVADKCGAPAQQVTDDMYRAFMTAFNCSGPRIANCPARPPPTEEDANIEMGFNQFTSGMGMGLNLGLDSMTGPHGGIH